MRTGATDEALLDIFRKALKEKARDGWESQHQTAEQHRDSMTQIGG
jgi:hypothetical protein